MISVGATHGKPLRFFVRYVADSKRVNKCVPIIFMSLLFSPLELRSIKLKNRIVMSPMCQYSAVDGYVTDWHLLHYPARALGGVGLVMVEATAVEARGRISAEDLGIWSDDHILGLQELTQKIKANGAVPSIQLAHAGRKAGSSRPWHSEHPGFSWLAVAPSAVAFSDQYPQPKTLEISELEEIKTAFVKATSRAIKAGFEIIELHMAHGYLLHSFLSPFSNTRSDQYGGTLENRMRFPLEVIKATRAAMPDSLPLLVRISATDWAEGGWTLEDTVQFARAIKDLGVDLLDCSSGGSTPSAKIAVGAGFQVEFAATVRRETGLATGAVGMITNSQQAEQILRSGQADLIFLARVLLANPFWAYQAAKELGVKENVWAVQYDRAFPK
jgi:2,4-dienoyl-CoA reductase-like NADH-dependent reductase (Old Yellow Enzyme family)